MSLIGKAQSYEKVQVELHESDFSWLQSRLFIQILHMRRGKENGKEHSDGEQGVREEENN